ncbi:Tryp_alpha_amyl domain-containing protein [Cephalotus follicularis]|uniref:Non-specific lipid-transfer protein n=1 Tax=Cephalotus follicularis TaxID=3775 RepID=A0A1Q3CAE3_CEPFO|nr:Tryp_alpha_amyl domain-containing protein [Cephalotus follicularis]
MAVSSIGLKLACVVVMCLVVGAPVVNAISCSQVVSALMPCLPYLRNGGRPGLGCCNGVSSLNAVTRSTSDKQTACGCMKTAYSAIPGINAGNAEVLPVKCGVSIPYKISPSTDCKKVK